MSQEKKPLDMVVKLGIGVMITSFILIFGGMFLTRPDRSIPPYSIGSQEETTVAIHVPSWTSDSEIETLILRFRKIGIETRNFGLMKIRPTTPDDPKGQYQDLLVLIFTNDIWTEPETLHRYLQGADSSLSGELESSVRGLYRLEGDQEEGRLGRILSGPDTPATQAYSRVLFRGPLESIPQKRNLGKRSSKSTVEEAS